MKMSPGERQVWAAAFVHELESKGGTLEYRAIRAADAAAMAIRALRRVEPDEGGDTAAMLREMRGEDR